MVVDMGESCRQAKHFDRFPGAQIVKYTAITEDEIRGFLDGLTVVYSAETFYDDRFINIARELGVRTVLQPNYEFMREIKDPTLPRPDLFLAPSSWNYDRFPSPKALLPFPVARDRLPFRLREKVETILHVVGTGTMADRNGTRLLLEALRWVAHPCLVVIRSQVRVALGKRHWPPFVDVVNDVRDVENYWDVYDGADALVLCRRYGGLCLPLNEAASLGLPVIVTDRQPEAGFIPDAARVPGLRPQPLRTPVGRVEAVQADPRGIAARINALLADPGLVAILSAASDAYAESISWERMAEPFRAVLAGERVEA
jgi:glycosyltransferase involved in cell wall biosynthesis